MTLTRLYLIAALASAACAAGTGSSGVPTPPRRTSTVLTLEEINERLFRAYFSEGKNIGDPAVLRDIAQAAGVPGETIDRAWSLPPYEERLKRQHETASGIGVTAIPTFIIGNRWIVEGAVPVDLLRKVAKEVAAA